MVCRRVVVGERDPVAGATVAALLSPLGLRVVPAARGIDVLAAVADPDSPALVLLSADLKEPCAYEVLHRLRESFGASLPVAVLAATEGSEDRDEVASLLLGAVDYFYKPLQPDRFVARVRRMITAPYGSRGPASRSFMTQPKLTNREREVLTLLAEGSRSAEIAQLLCITRKTAATHIERILTKLDVHSQAQAVAYALREGIVESARDASLAVMS